MHQDYSQAFMLGGMKGVLSLFVEHPFDAVKTSCQARQRPIIPVARDLFAENGVYGFYKGLGPNAIRLISKQTIRSPLFLMVSRGYDITLPDEHLKKHPNLVKIYIGFTIASFETLFISPLDRLKVFFITKNGNSNGLNLFYNQNKGALLSEIFRGIGATYARQIASWTSFLVIDRQLIALEKERTGDEVLSLASQFVVSVVGGGINTLLNMPLDTAKTNLQKEGYLPNAGLWKTILFIYRKHGAKGLYAGWQVRAMQYMVQSLYFNFLEKSTKSTA